MYSLTRIHESRHIAYIHIDWCNVFNATKLSTLRASMLYIAVYMLLSPAQGFLEICKCVWTKQRY